MWPSSVVLMKKSIDALTRAGSSCQATTIWSTYSLGVSPCSSATRATLSACSSTPVRKYVSLAPLPVMAHEDVAAIVVYA